MHTTINMLQRQKGGAESAKVISSLCSFSLPSQCVFDGGQRFTFVLQVLLQLSERMVPLLSIQQDLLHLRKKNISVSIIKLTHPNKWMLLHISHRIHVSRIYSLLFSHFFYCPTFLLFFTLRSRWDSFVLCTPYIFFIIFSSSVVYLYFLQHIVLSMTWQHLYCEFLGHVTDARLGYYLSSWQNHPCYFHSILVFNSHQCNFSVVNEWMWIYLFPVTFYLVLISVRCLNE